MSNRTPTRLFTLLVVGFLVATLCAASTPWDPYADLRREMVSLVARQLQTIAVTDPQKDQKILEAMGRVPRHLFVPEQLQGEAYADRPLPLGTGSTIHQPYIVALMTSLLELDRGAKVLEIGTGSGYHSAVLSELAYQVFSIEIDPKTATRARGTLKGLRLDNVHLKTGDGYQGWRSEAPFDAILVTAAPERIPQPLIEQLRIGGKLVVPEGGFIQNLVVLTRTRDGYEKRTTIPVKLPPMSGEVRQSKP